LKKEDKTMKCTAFHWTEHQHPKCEKYNYAGRNDKQTGR